MAECFVPQSAVIRQFFLDTGVCVNDGGDDSFWGFKDSFPGDNTDDDTLYDRVVLVKATSPILDGRSMQSGRVVQHPGIQVLVRAESDELAIRKINNCFYYLTEVLYRTLVTVDTIVYRVHCFNPSSGPDFLKQEEKNRRRLYGFNGNLTVAPEL